MNDFLKIKHVFSKNYGKFKNKFPKISPSLPALEIHKSHTIAISLCYFNHSFAVNLTHQTDHSRDYFHTPRPHVRLPFQQPVTVAVRAFSIAVVSMEAHRCLSRGSTLSMVLNFSHLTWPRGTHFRLFAEYLFFFFDIFE